jgi:hypothetical protein
MFVVDVAKFQICNFVTGKLNRSDRSVDWSRQITSICRRTVQDHCHDLTGSVSVVDTKYQTDRLVGLNIVFPSDIATMSPGNNRTVSLVSSTTTKCD